MPADAQSARDDVAFLRALINGGESLLPGFGEAYLAAGVIYGAQILLHAAQALGWAPVTPPAAWLIGLGPTALFIPVVVWINWRHRHDRPPAAVGRAIGAAFGAAGLANLALLVVIGFVAWRERSFTTWFIYPCTVLILQGTVWFIAALLRRRGWMAAVGAGFFAAAIGMALSVQSIGLYLAFLGAGLWFCMALPGWLMMRLSRRAAAGGALAAA